MPIQSPSFRRLVLGLQPDVPDRSMRLAVELADLLRLDLLGLFLDDTSLRDLARMPFAREFRGPLGGWHPIDIDRVSHELELAAHAVRRLFDRAAKQLNIRARFETMQGPVAESIEAISRAGDIIAIAEPANPAARATSQFSWLCEAAFRSASAVLLVPPRIVRTKGPVVALAGVPDDPSIRVAASIAMALKEELVVIDADHIEHSGDVHRMGADLGLKVGRIAARKGALPNAATCAQAFRQLEERLVVMTRGVFDDAVASTVASARHVPVLVIEPPESATKTEPQSAAA